MRKPAMICSVAGALLLLAAGMRTTLAPFALARLLILGAALGSLALHDMREHRIPNRIVLPAAGVCALLPLAEGVRASTGLYVGAALVALLLLVSLMAPAVLGMGDVKLALLLLCALGSFASLALLIALELYALLAVALIARRGRTMLGTSLALAPIIATSCLLTVLL